VDVQHDFDLLQVQVKFGDLVVRYRDAGLELHQLKVFLLLLKHKLVVFSQTGFHFLPQH
jgi:hypothetical protein